MRAHTAARHPRLALHRVVAGVTLALMVGVVSVGCGGQEAPLASLAPSAAAPSQPPSAVLAPNDAAVPEQPNTNTSTAPLAESEPGSIAIPALGVRSELMDLGVQEDGTMEVPPGAYPAGWYTPAPTPGELGPAVIAAHVDWNGKPGVFHDIDELEPGDELRVQRQDGITALFRVERVEQYQKDQFPTDAVYGNIDHAGLRLITCGGEFNQDAGSYLDNVVVYARLAGSSST